MGEYQLQREAANESGANIAVGIARLHNVYGPRSLYGSGSQALPALIRKAIHHPAEPFTIWGSGQQYRDFLYIDDAISGILAVRERGMNRGPIQLGTGEAITLHRAAIEVARLAKDLSRSRTILDWKSKVGIAEGLEATFKWILRDMARSPAAPTPGNTAAAALMQLPLKLKSSIFNRGQPLHRGNSRGKTCLHCGRLTCRGAGGWHYQRTYFLSQCHQTEEHDGQHSLASKGSLAIPLALYHELSFDGRPLDSLADFPAARCYIDLFEADCWVIRGIRGR